MQNKNLASIENTKYTVMFPDGHQMALKYSEIKQHNEDIIEDNCAYGYMHPGDYTEDEVCAYEKEATTENKKFLAFLRSFPSACIVFDQTTELYKMPGEE